MKEHTENDHSERNPQGLGNRSIEEPRGVVDTNSAVVRDERLDGDLGDSERGTAWTVGRVLAPYGIERSSLDGPKPRVMRQMIRSVA